MPIAMIVLAIVLLVIMFRQWLPFYVPIWGAMLFGAVAVLLMGKITIPHAWHAISFPVMGYLFGVFILAEALDASGYLARLTDKLFARCRHGFHALFIIVFILGILSALLMNDTLAIVGTPIILQLAKKHENLSQPLLLALAFSITLGSVFSPVGNPQNVLIALNGQLDNPFVQFFTGLFLPTLINLVITYGIVAWFYRKVLAVPLARSADAQIKDARTAMLSKLAIGIMVLLIVSKIALEMNHASWDVPLYAIALVPALPIVLFSQKRVDIIKKMDWGTLIFFVSMFVLMQSVWDSGFFQQLIQRSHIVVSHVPTILIISTLLSQLISNVPLVALYLPLIQHVSQPVVHFLALAAGSTVAGNFLLFGAASNLIIVHNAERRGCHSMTFLAFAKIGILLTLINVVIYAIFLQA